MTRLVESRRARFGAALHGFIQAVEASEPLRRAASKSRAKVEPALGGRSQRELLHGTWLGHSAHPFFTDFPEGAWMAASFLDLFGPEGSEAASRRLLGFGLIAALPTIATGVADWSNTEGAGRQSGFVHGVTSSLATLLYAASYAARRRDKHLAGVVIGVAGGVVAVVDGWVGGHLSLARGAGVGKSALERPPADWTPTSLEVDRLIEGSPNNGVAGVMEIAVVRRDRTLFAVSARCSFDAALLADGTLWEDIIVCPACGSGFRAGDGSVSFGPASVPLAVLEARGQEGRVEVRAAQRSAEL